MALESKDIIQIDATVIAGISVLFTLSSITQIFPDNMNRHWITTMTVSIVLPFAISAIAAINDNERIARRGLTIGFYYIIVVMIIMSILAYLGTIFPSGIITDPNSNNNLASNNVQNSNANTMQELITFPWIQLSQFAISGAVAGFALYFSNRLLDYYRRPIITVDKRNSPVVRTFDIQIYKVDVPHLMLVSSLQTEYNVTYAAHRIIVRNTGINAAENCKAVLRIGGHE